MKDSFLQKNSNYSFLKWWNNVKQSKNVVQSVLRRYIITSQSTGRHANCLTNSSFALTFCNWSEFQINFFLRKIVVSIDYSIIFIHFMQTAHRTAYNHFRLMDRFCDILHSTLYSLLFLLLSTAIDVQSICIQLNSALCIGYSGCRTMWTSF